MRGCYSDGDDDRFFDCHEEVSSLSDGDLDRAESCSCSSFDPITCVLGYSQYEIWNKYPESVHERRKKFLNTMDFGFDRDFVIADDSEDDSCYNYELRFDRITASSGAVLGTCDFQNEICVNQSSNSLQSYEASDSSENGSSEPTFIGGLSRRSVSLAKFQGTSRSSSSSSAHALQSRGGNGSRDMAITRRKPKRGWLKKLGALAHIVDRRGAAGLKPRDNELASGTNTQRVRVHHHKKQSKELSSLYTGQEFVAHEGSILTMKFSLDGQYLASAGEDGTVRVWKVTEDEKSDRFALSHDTDRSYLYFSIDHLSQLAKFDIEKEGCEKPTCVRTSDSTCVILPSKVFRILEKPLHEFHGHGSEVLDLSWSKNGVSISRSKFL